MNRQLALLGNHENICSRKQRVSLRFESKMDIRQVENDIKDGLCELVVFPGKSPCWKYFCNVRYGASGEEVFGVACCRRCQRCLVYKVRGLDGKVKVYGTKNMNDHLKTCLSPGKRILELTPLPVVSPAPQPPFPSASLELQAFEKMQLFAKRFCAGSDANDGSNDVITFPTVGSQVPPTSVDESFGKKQDESISIKEEVQLVTQDTTPRPCDVQPSTSSLVPNISAAWSMPTSPSTSRGSPPNPTAGGSGVTTGATTMCLSPQLQFADSGDDEFSLSQKEHSLRMELLMYQLETARQQREMAQKEHEANMNLVWRKIEMVEVQKQWMEMQMDKMKDNAGMMGMQQFEDPTEQSATLLPD